MREVITKEELFEILDYKQMQYEVKVKFALDYIKQQDVASVIVNKIIDYLKKTRYPNQKAVQTIFIEELKKLFYKSSLCPNETSFRNVSNYLITMSGLIQLAMKLNRTGNRLKENKDVKYDELFSGEHEKELQTLIYPDINVQLSAQPDIAVKEEQKVVPVIKKRKRKRKTDGMTPEQIEEAKRIRLAKQAQVMREAKERKRLENLNK